MNGGKEDMKKYSGNLLSYLNDTTKSTVMENAQDNTKQTVEIEMIDANDIIPNQQNFYGIRDIEKLAKSMALSGHVSPLEVVPQDDGKYRLLSGERRRAAVLLRKERGEIENALVPCIVREKFVGNEDLTADQLEMISIIMANDYREKTPFEQLDEILKLEPIARVFWRKEQAEADGNMEAFRKFFAEKFLGMSSSSLQRILAFQKLPPEAKKAFEDGKISKTALAMLSGWPEEEQYQFFDALNSGDVKGTMADVEAFHARLTGEGEAEPSAPSETPTEGNPSDDNGPQGEEDAEPFTEEPETDDVPQDDTEGDGEETSDAPTEPATPRQPKPLAADTNAMPEFPTDINPNLSPEEVEKDGTNWVIEALNRLAEMAEEQSQKAAEDGHNREAKLWNLRKAAVELVIESVQ